VTAVVVKARRPVDVARDVARLVEAGHHAFMLRRIDHGGMLDLERLGAARYVAGLESAVELEEESPVPVAAAR
jgi:L-alanine-DL-glutamate epimerase-like enolase superfamily enzyme